MLGKRFVSAKNQCGFRLKIRIKKSHCVEKNQTLQSSLHFCIKIAKPPTSKVQLQQTRVNLQANWHPARRIN